MYGFQDSTITSLLFKLVGELFPKPLDITY